MAGYLCASPLNAITWILVTPSFAGLLLVQARLSALAEGTDSAANESNPGRLIVELLWLWAAMLRFLITFADAITGGPLALGALRGAMITYGASAASLPAVWLLTYGGLFTAMAALIFVPGVHHLAGARLRTARRSGNPARHSRC